MFRPLLAFLLCTLALTRCGYVPPVIGQEDVLVVLCSEEDRPFLEPIIDEVFGRTMATPSPESYFKVRWESVTEFKTFRRYKSLVVASLANPADSTADLLIDKILGEERVREARAGGNPIFVASNFLANGQMFMALVALDAVHARQEISRLKAWIFDQFEQQLRIRQYKAMCRQRENRKLAQRLEADYRWSMKIQSDYVLVKEKPRKDFVWLGRGYPYRWLSVHWVEQGDTVRLTPTWAWRRMESIAEEGFVDIYIDTLFRSTELGSENGHTITILRGIWGHRTQVAGGPFFTYMFRDREQNRIYFITGVVFNPGGVKALLIRQQEVIARTFHTLVKPADSEPTTRQNALTSGDVHREKSRPDHGKRNRPAPHGGRAALPGPFRCAL